MSITRRHALATLSISAAGALLAASLAVAGTRGQNGDGSKRIPICHATSSATNPYVMNRPAADSIVSAVHDGAIEGHGTHERDIIPAFSFTWRGRDYSFPGQNLDGQGAAILANNCRVPSPPPIDPRSPAGPGNPGDPGDPGNPGTPASPEDPANPTGGGTDPDSPTNILSASPIDDIAPRGLGSIMSNRSVATASPDEAVLRVRIRPSNRRPLVGTSVVFTVTGSSLGPAEATKPVLCASVPPRFALSFVGEGMVLGRVICWTTGIAAKGSSVRRFTATALPSSAGRKVPAIGTNSADNAYRVTDITEVRPRVRLPAVTG